MNIVAAIEQQERLAVGYGSLQEERSDALDRYLGRPYGDEQEGRSQVVMRDVHDTIEWIKPSLMKVFASGDEVCTFNPVGPEDEEQAQQETDYVNHVLMQKNDGFLILHDWFHDALLQKTGYVLVNFEEEQRATRETYRGLTDDEWALIAGNPEIEIVQHAEEMTMLDDGTMYRTHSAVVAKKILYGCIKVRNIPPERVLVASDWPGLNLQECPFVEVIDWRTVSDLRQEGFEVEDTIDDNSQYSEDMWEELRRDVMFDGTVDREDIEADPSTRRLRTRRVWMRYDEDGDGIAELRHIVIVGTTILHNEEADLVPVAAITPQRMPHEHYGISVADNVLDLQRIRTTLVRGFLDNMYLANNGRNAIDATRVNIDDMLVSRPGGIVRVQGDPSGAIQPLQHVQQGPAILQAIEYVDTVRENRTGVTKYNQGLDANSLNKTASGVSQIMTAAQQRIEMIARIFAETGVKALMQIIHAMSLKNTRQAEMVKLRNKWVQVDPRTWTERKDLTVSVGLGTGNKDQMLMHLQMVLQMQMQALQLGVASPKNVYNAAVKLTQNAGFKMPEQFWTDPETLPPPGEQAPPPEVQKEQMRLQADAQKFQAQTQIEQQKAMQEAELERERMAMQTQIDANRQAYEAEQQRQKLELEAEIERQKLEHAEKMKAAELAFQKWKAELDAQIAQEQARLSQPDLEGFKTQLASEISQIVTSPPKYIRDESGQVVAVERNGVRRNVARDQNGRVVGLE